MREWVGTLYTLLLKALREHGNLRAVKKSKNFISDWNQLIEVK